MNRYRTAERGREVIAKLFNMEKLTALAIEALKNKYEDFDASNVKVWTSALIENYNFASGVKWAVVNTEGVGVVGNEKTFAVFASSGMQGDWVDIDINKMESALSDETANLADFIREFGERLENNFDLWFEFATSKTK